MIEPARSFCLLALFTSCLPHADPIHLVFNLYWLTVFGRRVEMIFGSLTTALWLLVFETGSAVAEYDLAAFRRAVELDPELADDLETAEWLEANDE